MIQDKLTADARPKYIHRYTVIGSGYFPVDMLRYDAAWPDSQEDAGRILDFEANREVKLRSYRIPTIARWKSFGWQVN